MQYPEIPWVMISTNSLPKTGVNGHSEELLFTDGIDIYIGKFVNVIGCTTHHWQTSENIFPKNIIAWCPKPHLPVREWEYTCTTETIWGNFDNGVVKASTRKEAKALALVELKSAIHEINTILDAAGQGQPNNWLIEMNFDNLILREL